MFTSLQGDPVVNSLSQCMPNQYWRIDSASVSADHSACGVVRM